MTHQDNIVLQVQRQANGTYSVFDALTGNTVTEGLQSQNYDVVVGRMAEDRGGSWEEIAPAESCED